MAQASLAQGRAPQPQGDAHGKTSLGPFLCWAVVFADIGSSIYYVPGILYSSVGGLAGFFVLLTMLVFILLTLKYAEVSTRFPEGGGVVSVAAQSLNAWAGALGGMFILVSYFLTAAISCLSAIQYLSVVFPALLPSVLWITIGVLILLGLLNWIGISESAKVSLIAALVAFLSDLAVLWTVFTHVPPMQIASLFLQVFAKESVTPTSILVGFAGAFLAFSGLESISQLSPVMKAPRKKVIGLALLLVVLTIGLTSPLLTVLTTLLLPEKAADEVHSTQLLSLLGGHWGNTPLQAEVAISASLILIFAGNTSIIGAYHVFLALSRMNFFPAFILKRNRFRDTPHYSIALATGIPILVLVFVNGKIVLLGDMYAFGLLAAFTLTCLGLDIIRYRERKAGHSLYMHQRERLRAERDAHEGITDPSDFALASVSTLRDPSTLVTGTKRTLLSRVRLTLRALWHRLDFWLGVLTTALVFLACSIGLVSKPVGATFAGSAVLVGMAVAASTYVRRGLPPVVPTPLEGRLPGSVLAILMANDEGNERVIESALRAAEGKPVVFLYLSEPRTAVREPRPFEIVDPYLDDQAAKDTLGKAEQLASKRKIARRFVYQPYAPDVAARVWRFVQPHDVVLDAEQTSQCGDINPDRIRYEVRPEGKVAHLLKRW